jgi:hypothetical protein
LLVGLAVVATCTLAFFQPLLCDFTFSTVAGQQRSVFPWRAYDNNPYADVAQSDQAALSYPWQAFVTRSVRAGDLPLWNPLSFSGQPFFTNGSSGVLYPPRLMAALLLSPSGVHDFLSVMHVLGAGLAMFLLCRQLRLDTIGSLLGATSWMFASFNLAWLHLEVVSPVMLYVPFSMLLVRRAVESPGVGNVVAGAIVLGCTLVSGHLLFMGLVWAAAVAYGVTCLIAASWRARRSTGSAPVPPAYRLLAVVLGGPLLFACALWPTFLSIQASNRRPVPYEAFHMQVRSDPQILRYVFLPPPLPATEERMNRHMAFAGTVAGLLALGGAFLRGPAPALGRTAAAGVLLLALDTPLLRLAYAVAPGFSLFRPLGRLFFLLNFAIALLAAAGLDGLVRALNRRAQAADAPASGATAHRRSVTNAALYAIAIAAVLANSVQLLRYGRALNRTFHPRTTEFLFPRTPLIRAASRHVRARVGRILPLRSPMAEGQWSPPILYGSQHMVFGLPSLGGYDSVVPEHSLHVSLVAAGKPVEQVLSNTGVGAYVSDYPLDRVRFDLLSRLGITTILAPPGVGSTTQWSRAESVPLTVEYSSLEGEVYGLEGAPGRVWMTSRATFVDTPADALRRVADAAFDFRKEVILLRQEASSAPSVAYDAMSAGDVQIETDTNNHLRVRIGSPAGGWLVVADSWDRGWHATLDGRPTPILQANYAFRAILVPRGDHGVEMRYTPSGLSSGLLWSTASWLAIGAVVFRRRHLRRDQSVLAAGAPR